MSVGMHCKLAKKNTIQYPSSGAILDNMCDSFSKGIFTNLPDLYAPKQLKNHIYKFKWHGNTLLHFSKKSHKTGKIPVLGKPAHMLINFFLQF